MKSLVLKHVLGLPVDDVTIVLCSYFEIPGLIQVRSNGISLLLSLGLSGRGLLLSTTSAVFGSEASLPSSNHNLEALEISKFIAASISEHLLVGTVVSPLFVEIGSLSSFGKSTISAASLDVKFDACQSESLERVNNSWELLLGVVDENTIGIEDVDDHDHFAVVFAIVDEANSTWFNEIFKTLKRYIRIKQLTIFV